MYCRTSLGATTTTRSSTNTALKMHTELSRSFSRSMGYESHTKGSSLTSITLIGRGITMKYSAWTAMPVWTKLPRHIGIWLWSIIPRNQMKRTLSRSLLRSARRILTFPTRRAGKTTTIICLASWHHNAATQFSKTSSNQTHSSGSMMMLSSNQSSKALIISSKPSIPISWMFSRWALTHNTHIHTNQEQCGRKDPKGSQERLWRGRANSRMGRRRKSKLRRFLMLMVRGRSRKSLNKATKQQLRKTC